MQKDHHLISLSKGVTWRILGTLDTMMLSYIFTGSIESALKIGGTEVFTKILLFFFHERLWFRIKWGLKRKIVPNGMQAMDYDSYDNKDELWEESHLRSVIKGISWRMVGTLDTIIIATFWTGDYSKALKIGVTEVVTKVILFYFHERAWMRLTRKNAPDPASVTAEQK
jgi:uncharacterized membrane protein